MTLSVILAVAAGVAAGVPFPVLGLLATAWWAPVPALALAAAGAFSGARRSPGKEPGSEASRIVSLAAELRAGATLRAALGTLSPVVGRLAAAGRPVDELVDAVGEALPRHGALVGAVTVLADRIGGSVAPLFEELAVAALEADELDREVRIATAPAYVQGAIVGGLPLVAMVRLVASGAVSEASGAGTVVAVAVGVALVAAGVVAVAVLVRRATR